VRWWKQFREDYDRPGMQLGIERFGTGFVHDVGRVWQFLCVEDGPGLREIILDEMLGVLARQFRVPSEEALARIEFMASVNLIDIGTRRGSEVRVISSKELKNRRDEWSRKVQKAKGKSKSNDSVATPESRRSNSGTESDADAEAEAKADKSLTTVDSLTSDLVCSQKNESFWEFTGVKREKLPVRFKTTDFDADLKIHFEQYRASAHDEDGTCLCSPVDFLASVRDYLTVRNVEYPAAFLAVQTRWERIEQERCQKDALATKQT
jgi:hypothetical protein